MKITVRHRETEIIIDESDNPSSGNTIPYTSLKYNDQNKLVLNTLTEIVKHIETLNK